jgi:hypothetical protein
VNNQTFDAIAHRLPSTTSRRDIARTGGSVFATAILAHIGLSPSGGLSAKSGTCKKSCGECERCNPGKCRKTKNGKKWCRRGTCKPTADFTNCSFGFCFEGVCKPT